MTMCLSLQPHRQVEATALTQIVSVSRANTSSTGESMRAGLDSARSVPVIRMTPAGSVPHHGSRQGHRGSRLKKSMADAPAIVQRQFQEAMAGKEGNPPKRRDRL